MWPSERTGFGVGGRRRFRVKDLMFGVFIAAPLMAIGRSYAGRVFLMLAASLSLVGALFGFASRISFEDSLYAWKARGLVGWFAGQILGFATTLIFAFLLAAAGYAIVLGILSL